MLSDLLTDLLAGGRIVDLILVVVAVEAVAVAILNRLGIIGLRLLDIAATLLSGAFLFVALKLALSGAAAEAIAVCLALALAAHIVDIARRVLTGRRAENQTGPIA